MGARFGRIGVILAVALSLAACLSPYETSIPADAAARGEDIAYQLAVRRLSARERTLLSAFLAYAEMVVQEGRAMRPGTTIGEALSAQQSYQREEGARRQRQLDEGRLLPVPRNTPVLYRLSQ